MEYKKRPLVGPRKLTKFMLLGHIGQNFRSGEKYKF
jgi:hypothetical protein